MSKYLPHSKVARQGLKTRRWSLFAFCFLILIYIFYFLISPAKKPDLPLIAELRVPSSSSPVPHISVLAFSPDGSTLATTVFGQGIGCWDLTSKTLQTAPDPNFWGSFSGHSSGFFDRQGQRIGALSLAWGTTRTNWELTIHDVAGKVGPSMIKLGGRPPMNLRFADDGSTIHVIQWERTLGPPTLHLDFQSFDVATRKELSNRKLVLDSPQDGQFRISRDESRLVGAVQNSPDLTVWDLSTGHAIGALKHTKALATSLIGLAISPDGSTAALAQTDGSIEIWDLKAFSLRTTLRGRSTSMGLSTLSFSNDGNVLNCEGEEFLATVPQNAEFIVKRLTQGSRAANDLVETDIFDLRRGKLIAKLRGEWRPVLSENGKQLATMGHEGMIRIWDLSTK